MSLSMIVGGTVAIDNVITPKGEQRSLLGGSASYAALSASYYHQPVALLGVIGKDYPVEHLEMLSSKGVDLGAIEKSDGDSFTWTGEYFENMNDRTTHEVGLNVLESWSVKVPEVYQGSEVVVLANMAPQNQLEMLEQCSEAKFVIADTMDLWISIANEQLHEVLKKIDLLVINEGEAREFAKTSNLVKAGHLLLEKGPQYVIIKLGEFGAMLFGQNQGEFFRCGAYPLEEVVDPTGAGDSFLGAFAGFLAAGGNSSPSFRDLKQAVIEGSVMASFTCEGYSTRVLQELTAEKIETRKARFIEMQTV